MNKENNKYKFFKIKKGNVKVFSFFLIASFMFLLLSKFSESYTKNITLNISLHNLQEGIVVNKDSIPSAKINIKTEGFSLLRYMFNSYNTISLDTKTDLIKQKDKFVWDIKNAKKKLKSILGQSVEIIDIEPDSIYINFYQLEVKKVPIVLNSKISLASGYDTVGDVELSQDSVKIIGSKPVIDSISSVRTKLLVLENVKKDFLANVSLITNSNIETAPSSIRVNAKVRAFTEGQFSLPIFIANVPEGKTINFFPKQVKLTYYIDVENYSQIKPDDFKIEANFADINLENQQTLGLRVVKKPELIKDYRLQQKRIQFVISE